MIETLDSEKLATKLNKEIEKLERTTPIQVLVQVHTGGEASKHGVEPEEVPSLINHIKKDCPLLQFSGLMSMGLLHDIEGFKTMASMKKEYLELSGLTEDSFVLSMGTSADYEEAILEGSTEVRLGTTIFGARDYKKKE